MEPSNSPSDVSIPFLIECQAVQRHYGPSEARTTALAGVDLNVKAGEQIAVVGPSGSGKSTLLQLIGAMDAPDHGKVLVDGRDLASLKDDQAARFRRETIGFVFQFFNLIPTINAQDNIALPAQLSGMPAQRARARARELLETVSLAERAEAYPDALSGGQQQRVAIARALINEPRILLADEPTGALDKQTSEEILNLLTSLTQSRGLTMLMATHSEECMASMQRLIRIEDGRIVEDRALAKAVQS